MIGIGPGNPQDARAAPGIAEAAPHRLGKLGLSRMPLLPAPPVLIVPGLWSPMPIGTGISWVSKV